MGSYWDSIYRECVESIYPVAGSCPSNQLVYQKKNPQYWVTLISMKSLLPFECRYPYFPIWLLDCKFPEISEATSWKNCLDCLKHWAGKPFEAQIYCSGVPCTCVKHSKLKETPQLWKLMALWWCDFNILSRKRLHQTLLRCPVAINASLPTSFFSVNQNVMRMWLIIFSFMHQLLHFAKTVICSGVFASLTVKHEKVVLTTGHWQGMGFM